MHFSSSILHRSKHGFLLFIKPFNPPLLSKKSMMWITMICKTRNNYSVDQDYFTLCCCSQSRRSGQGAKFYEPRNVLSTYSNVSSAAIILLTFSLTEERFTLYNTEYCLFFIVLFCNCRLHRFLSKKRK